MKSILWVVCLLALLRPTTNLSAQVNPYKDGTPGVTGYRSEVLAEVMIQEDKFVRLAEAIPPDKYAWRPTPDVRSFAEVFLHVAAANYNIYKLVGTPTPAGVDVKGLEKSTTDKAKVIATLKDSFAHARKAITALPDADLDKSLDWFGGKNTERGILLFVTRHAAEHLGQSIAYALRRSSATVDRRRPEAAETKTRVGTQNQAIIVSDNVSFGCASLASASACSYFLQ